MSRSLAWESVRAASRALGRVRSFWPRRRRAPLEDPARYLVSHTTELSARERVAALAWAQRSGCPLSAERHASVLCEQLTALDPALRRKAVPLIAKAWLPVGASERLAHLLRHHGSDLDPVQRTRAEAALWVHTGVAVDAWKATPPGLDSPFALEQLRARGALSPEELGVIFRSDWRRHAARPELDLLLYNAIRDLDRDAARRLWARFATARGVPAPELGSTPTRFPESFGWRREQAPSPSATVSVILPAFRAAGTIVAALESLLAQTLRPLEILVADDASDDGTLELVRQRFGSGPSVRVFRSRGNQGSYNLRNALSREARGEFLAFHDADDLAAPTRLERQLGALCRSGAVACYTNWLRLRPDGTVVFFWDDSPRRLCLASLVIERRRFEALGGFRRARFGADLELYQRLLATHGDAALVRVRAPLLLGGWASASVTRRSGAEALETGYRAPARLAYAELAARRRFLGERVVPEDEIVTMLREFDNLADPEPIEELGPSSR